MVLLGSVGHGSGSPPFASVHPRLPASPPVFVSPFLLQILGHFLSFFFVFCSSFGGFVKTKLNPFRTAVPFWGRDKPLKFQVVCPRNGTTVLKGLSSPHFHVPISCRVSI